MNHKTKNYSFTVPKNDNIMEKFDSIIKPVDRSTAIRSILQYIVSLDPNFLRRLLGLPEMELGVIPSSEVPNVL